MKTNPIGGARGESLRVGIWQNVPSPAISRLLARMGWDWIILDMQHGPMSFEVAYECVHAINALGAAPLVRVGIGSPFEVERALDIGAHGVVVPMVNSVEEARTLAAAAKYPPLGTRSHGGDAALHYGGDYADRANRETLLLVQVEHIDAVRAVEDILGIEGVDGCFVGPTDLALSLGLGRTGYEDVPVHRDAIARTVEAARRLGKLACCNTYSLEDFGDKVEDGFQGLTFKSEVDLLVGAGGRLLEQLRLLACGADQSAGDVG